MLDPHVRATLTPDNQVTIPDYHSTCAMCGVLSCAMSLYYSHTSHALLLVLQHDSNVRMCFTGQVFHKNEGA